MKTTAQDEVVLLGLLRSPYACDTEMSPLIAMQPGLVRRSLNRLLDGGLVSFVRHTRSETSRVRRWHLTADGLQHVAKLRETTPERLMLDWPVSAQWQRRHMRRLDAVSALYRVSEEVVTGFDTFSALHWFRSGAPDAMLSLPDTKRFLLMRLGKTLSWKATRSRLGTLENMHNDMRCPSALVITAGPLETERIAEACPTHAIRMHMASESDLLTTRHGSAVWRTHRSPAGLTLAQVVDGSERYRRAIYIGPIGENKGQSPESDGGGVTLDNVSTELTTAAWRMLHLLYDWPLVRLDQLAAMMGLSQSRLLHAQALLSKRGLICRLRIGETAEARETTGTRLCLSRDGLEYLARVDRRRASELMRHWLVEPDSTGDGRFPIAKHRIDGTKLRVLLGELRHTDAVSDFIGMLSRECLQETDWVLHQALPPHRWERYFHYNLRPRWVRPDATIKVAHRSRRRTLMLEYEETREPSLRGCGRSWNATGGTSGLTTPVATSMVGRRLRS